MKEFPKHPDHEAARKAGCFRCGKALDGKPFDTGFAPGTGRYRQECFCGFATFYDLAEGPPSETPAS